MKETPAEYHVRIQERQRLIDTPLERIHVRVTRPERLEALTRDLLADLDYYSSLTQGEP